MARILKTKITFPPKYFKTWILQQRDRGDNIGRLANMFSAFPDLPAGRLCSIYNIMDFLIARDENREVLKTAIEAYIEFLRDVQLTIENHPSGATCPFACWDCHENEDNY